MDAFLSVRLVVERGVRHGSIICSHDMRLLHLVGWLDISRIVEYVFFGLFCAFLFCEMREFAEFLTSAAVEAGDLVGTFPDAIDDASDILSENAVDRKDLVFYMFWALDFNHTILMLFVVLFIKFMKHAL